MTSSTPSPKAASSQGAVILNEAAMDWAVQCALGGGVSAAREDVVAIVYSYLSALSGAPSPAEALPSPTSGAEVGGDRFAGIMNGQDPSEVWRARAFQLADELDALAKPASEPAGGGVEARGWTAKSDQQIVDELRVFADSELYTNSTIVYPVLKRAADIIDPLASPAPTSGSEAGGEANFCESCAMSTATCDCSNPKHTHVDYGPRPKDPAALVAECARYLKPGETPRERMDRDFADAQALTKLLANERDRSATVFDALTECEGYFNGRADADCDQDGFVPNKEMRLLSVVRDAIAALAKPASEPAGGGVREALQRWKDGYGFNEDSDADVELSERVDAELASLSSPASSSPANKP